MKKVTREITIRNHHGLHARPSAMFVRVSSRHKCDIWVEKDGEQVNGKSIMGLMMLAAGCGAKLQVTAEGDGSDQAVQEISDLAERKFDEE